MQNLASLLLLTQDYDSAYDTYSKVIAIDNTNVAAWIGRIRILEQWGSFNDALEDLKYLLGCELSEEDRNTTLQLYEKVMLMIKSQYSWSMYS